MKSRWLFIVFCVVMTAMLVTSCGGNDETATPRGITGSWSGTWVSYEPEYDGTVLFNFIQDGDTLSGTVFVTGSVTFDEGTISGIVSDNTITFSVATGAYTVHYEATFTDTTLIGIYLITEVDPDAGTFEATRQ